MGRALPLERDFYISQTPRYGLRRAHFFLLIIDDDAHLTITTFVEIHVA